MRKASQLPSIPNHAGGNVGPETRQKFRGSADTGHASLPMPSDRCIEPDTAARCIRCLSRAGKRLGSPQKRACASQYPREEFLADIMARSSDAVDVVKSIPDATDSYPLPLHLYLLLHLLRRCTGRFTLEQRTAAEAPRCAASAATAAAICEAAALTPTSLPASCTASHH